MSRVLAVCLLLVVVGCGDDDSDGGGAAGSGGGGGGRSGSSASGGKGGSGSAGTSGKGGNGGSQPQGGGGGGGGGVGGASSGSGGSGGSAGAKMGMIKLVPNIVAGKQVAQASGNVGSQQNALRVGQPSATTLMSLKYYVTSIQLCEDLEQAGSGFSNPRGCISLYNNQGAGSPDYNTYTVEEAKNETTEGRYIDLMSSEGQAALRKPVMLQVPIATTPIPEPEDDDAADGGVPEDPPQLAGVYRFGLINFYRPIKVKAEFPIIGESGQYYRTKAVTAIHEMPGQNGGLGTERVDIGDTLSGATEETVYMLNNGGALFTFQKPFAITQADVDAKAEINIDLVFNPDHFGQAREVFCANDPNTAICDPLNNVTLDMPYVRMSPVPRKTGEKTRKETYMLDYDSNSKIRIELYYNDADSEKGVQGVDAALVYNSTVSGNMHSMNTIASNFVTQSGSVTTNDASVSLLDYRRMVNLEGLRRRQDGTATMHCIFTGSVCPTEGGTMALAYTYAGDTVVSGE